MDELRMFLENEGWELCPVKSSFHVLNLVVSVSSPKPFEPAHEISNNVVCATSKASYQPAHIRSLIRAFASR